MLRRNALSASPELSILFPGSVSPQEVQGIPFRLYLKSDPPHFSGGFFGALSELIGNCLRHSARQPVTFQSPHQNCTQCPGFLRSAWQQAVSQHCYALGSSPVPGTRECSKTEHLPDRDSIFRLGGSPGLASF